LENSLDDDAKKGLPDLQAEMTKLTTELEAVKKEPPRIDALN